MPPTHKYGKMEDSPLLCLYASRHHSGTPREHITIKVFEGGPDPQDYSKFAQRLIETGDDPKMKAIQWDPEKKSKGESAALLLSLEELARRW
ncbi:hypothetical protein ACFL2C_00475 [Patescibacteria group bacterium]